MRLIVGILYLHNLWILESFSKQIDSSTRHRHQADISKYHEQRNQNVISGKSDIEYGYGDVVDRRWNKRVITWSLVKPSSSFSVYVQREALRRAFGHWRKASGLDFQELIKPTNDVDIKISFERLNHTDNDYFDGKGGTLAHAFYPPDGRVHFDADEAWTSTAPGGSNLEVVATHELGHALGLAHSSADDTVMSSYYSGYSGKRHFSLRGEDVRRIQQLYGNNSNVDANRSRSSEGQTVVSFRSSESKRPDTCRMKFDDISYLPDGRIYVFKANLLYRLKEDLGVEEGWPKPLSSVLAGFPRSSDAITSNQRSGRLYAFKDDYVWRFFNNKLEAGFPKSLRGHRPKIKASFSHPNGSVYLLSRKYVYSFSEFTLKVEPVGRIRDVLRGAPYNPEAALSVEEGSLVAPGIYFFRGKWYYRLVLGGEDTTKVYRHNKGKEWLRCI